jgi:hypothetical protein
MLSKFTDRFKSSTHLISLNVRHFGMVEATGLIICSRGNIQCHHPPPPYNISSNYTNRFKSCAHLRWLNVRHFGMAEATRLKDATSRSP